MAVITPVNPIFMTNTVLTVASNDYAAALTSATLTPSQSVVSSKGLKPGARWVRLTAPEWKLETTFHQDDSATSFMTWLRDNVGTTKTFVLTPEDGSTRPRTVSVIIPAVQIGGSLETYAMTTVSFEVIGDVTTGALPA